MLAGQSGECGRAGRFAGGMALPAGPGSPPQPGPATCGAAGTRPGPRAAPEDLTAAPRLACVAPARPAVSGMTGSAVPDRPDPGPPAAQIPPRGRRCRARAASPDSSAGYPEGPGLPSPAMTAGDQDAGLERLRRQYPRWRIWRGRATGDYWALPPPGHPRVRALISAGDLGDLARRLARAEG